MLVVIQVNTQSQWNISTVGGKERSHDPVFLRLENESENAVEQIRFPLRLSKVEQVSIIHRLPFYPMKGSDGKEQVSAKVFFQIGAQLTSQQLRTNQPNKTET